MISFSDITKLFSLDLEGKQCIETLFSIAEHPEYQACWMGKAPDRANREKDLYWFGLVPDGSESYDYDNFNDLSTAPIFWGKALCEIWEKVEILSIDGCDPLERIGAVLQSLPS